MIIARVFPRKTKASPDDDLAYFGTPGLFPPQVDEVHVSVTFTWDLPYAENLAYEWERIAPVKIGGPATGEKGREFEPGKYIKPGYVITSRGCPNQCWFCSVWKRDGNINTLPITEGWNVLDDNLLACPDEHIKAVFEMLGKQKQRAEFTGGLEAARLKEWQARELYKLNPKQMFFAYDTPNDLEPLFEAGKLLKKVGFSPVPKGRILRAYVLCGYPGDTFDKAEKRLYETMDAGFMPMAMLFRNETCDTKKEWRKFQRQWARPAIIMSNHRALLERMNRNGQN